ncbi:hypothetical protein, partial [Coleofasciculus sp. E2-BRE-01]|uniref:hypothetical protein n=1 Tax=Coleofasciculus sp. E2-BRE-01 TaxID=3069524 RepID=UPI0032F9CB56
CLRQDLFGEKSLGALADVTEFPFPRYFGKARTPRLIDELNTDLNSYKRRTHKTFNHWQEPYPV